MSDFGDGGHDEIRVHALRTLIAAHRLGFVSP
jgi:hypothetical protein